MKRQIVSFTVIVLFAGSSIAGSSLLAQSGAKQDGPVVYRQEESATPDATQVAKDGYATVRAMHTARVAIFNGDPELAKKALANAKMLLEKTKKDEIAAGMKGDLIPIDGALALTDTFVSSPECTECISKANEHFSAGHKAQALEQLRLGEIEVNYARVLMPISATQKQLAKATDFANRGKFYECNLALKAAEDGLQLDSVTLVELSDAKEAAAVKKGTQGSTNK